MSKICIVGDYDSICAFGALGIDTFDVLGEDDAARMIGNLVHNDYCIILITENIAAKIQSVLEKYRTEPIPAIIPLPSLNGEGELGMYYLRKAVEQAVGSAEMIFGE